MVETAIHSLVENYAGTVTSSYDNNQGWTRRAERAICCGKPELIRTVGRGVSPAAASGYSQLGLSVTGPSYPLTHFDMGAPRDAKYAATPQL